MFFLLNEPRHAFGFRNKNSLLFFTGKLKNRSKKKQEEEIQTKHCPSRLVNDNQNRFAICPKEYSLFRLYSSNAK